MQSGIWRFSAIPKFAGAVVLAVLSTVHTARADPSPCSKSDAALLEEAGQVGGDLVAILRRCQQANLSPLFTAPVTVKSALAPRATEKRAAPLAHPAAGDVLMIGGFGKKTTATEFYDASTKKFAKTGFTGGPAAFTPVGFPAAGKILIAGGAYMVSAAGVLPAAEAKLYLTANAPPTAQLYDFAAGTVGTTTGTTLNVGRAYPTTTLISCNGCASDGQVLIAGGFDTTGAPLKSAELYNPATETFTLLTHTMTDARAMHTATLLGDGTVLLVGGIDRVAEVLFGLAAGAVATNSGEIFDPATQTFTAITEKMPLGAAGHTATLLQNGQVLIVGGFEITPDPFSPLGSSINQAVLYDPMAQTFTPTGSLTDDRVLHTATLLPNGSVLIAGGATVGLSWTIDVPTDVASIVFEAGSVARKTAEIYDPLRGTFTCVKKTKTLKDGQMICAASMAQARAGQSATLLPDPAPPGAVLIAGGWGTSAIQASAELFDPVPTKTSPNGTFKATGKMSTGHALHGALLVP